MLFCPLKCSVALGSWTAGVDYLARTTPLRRYFLMFLGILCHFKELPNPVTFSAIAIWRRDVLHAKHHSMRAEEIPNVSMAMRQRETGLLRLSPWSFTKSSTWRELNQDPSLLSIVRPRVRARCLLSTTALDTLGDHRAIELPSLVEQVMKLESALPENEIADQSIWIWYKASALVSPSLIISSQQQASQQTKYQPDLFEMHLPSILAVAVSMLSAVSAQQTCNNCTIYCGKDLKDFPQRRGVSGTYLPK